MQCNASTLHKTIHKINAETYTRVYVLDFPTLYHVHASAKVAGSLRKCLNPTTSFGQCWLWRFTCGGSGERPVEVSGCEIFLGGVENRENITIFSRRCDFQM